MPILHRDCRMLLLFPSHLPISAVICILFLSLSISGRCHRCDHPGYLRAPTLDISLYILRSQTPAAVASCNPPSHTHTPCQQDTAPCPFRHRKDSHGLLLFPALHMHPLIQMRPSPLIHPSNHSTIQPRSTTPPNKSHSTSLKVHSISDRNFDQTTATLLFQLQLFLAASA